MFKKIITSIVIILIIIAAAVYFLLPKNELEPLPPKSPVSVATDKAEYNQEEQIKITVTNTLQEDITLLSEYMVGNNQGVVLEKKSWLNKWQKVELPWEERIIRYKLLKPGQSHIYQWNQQIVDGEKVKPAGTGTYRIKVTWYYTGRITAEKLNYPTSYSNEFKIKKKIDTQTNSNQGITVSADKTEYAKGETVRIMVINDSNNDSFIYYQPFYTVEQYVNSNEWKPLKRVICLCGTKCELLASVLLKSKEIKEFRWDQQETWCEGNEEKSKQASFGKYRVMIIVGQKDENKEVVYSDEFEIKEKVDVQVDAGQGVTLGTNKTRYSKGEFIEIQANNYSKEKIPIVIVAEGTINQNGRIPLIEKKNILGKWQNLELSKYNGTIMPIRLKPGEEFAFIWDQSTFKGQASKGTYRAKIKYYYLLAAERYYSTSSNKYLTSYSNEFKIKSNNSSSGNSPLNNKSCRTHSDCHIVKQIIHTPTFGCLDECFNINYNIPNNFELPPTCDPQPPILGCRCVGKCSPVTDARLWNWVQIQQQIEKANYCLVDQDCVYECSNKLCDCYFINKQEQTKINNLINQHAQKYYQGFPACAVDPILYKKIVCKQGKCQGIR